MTAIHHDYGLTPFQHKQVDVQLPGNISLVHFSATGAIRTIFLTLSGLSTATLGETPRYYRKYHSQRTEDEGQYSRPPVPDFDKYSTYDFFNSNDDQSYTHSGIDEYKYREDYNENPKTNKHASLPTLRSIIQLIVHS